MPACTRPGVYVPRQTPPSDEELEAMRARQDEAASARDVLQRATSALSFVREHAAALVWTDAEAALAAKVRLKPALDRQLALAEEQLATAETAATAAERAMQAATERSNSTDAALKAITAALADERERFAELAIDDASDAALAAAEAAARRLAADLAELTQDERDLADKAATWAERLRGVSEKLAEAESDLADKTRAWEPEQKGWEALRDRAEQQGLLAATATPLIHEEMLEQGSVNLLDYREYLGLVVEVTRQGSAVWEVANPTRMSTGEAIGVGAALMMVVLTAWERDANLLRARRSLGTLRILFLDEANRLSQDNLAILFDLCEGLELQLLLAAPEVARAEGNTTYRLVRQLDAQGREDVLVTGRRIARA